MKAYPKFVATGELNPLTHEPLGKIVNSPEEEAALAPKAEKPTPGKPKKEKDAGSSDKDSADGEGGDGLEAEAVAAANEAKAPKRGKKE